MSISCPACNSTHVIAKNIGKRTGGLVGVIGGTASGAASALGGAEAGATVGIIGEDGIFAKKRPTLMFNGYESQVGQLYAGLDLAKNF